MSSYGDIIIFIGPPGSGKGSLSQLCVRKLGWMQLSTGNLCRKHIAENTSIGQKIDFAIKSGKLIEDGLVVEMVKQWLQDNLTQANAVILDGFPRTVAQAQALHKLLKEGFAESKIYVTKMSLANETIVQRLSSRSICQNNDCQAVYSTIDNSTLKSRDVSRCDECSHPLIRRADDSQQSIQERLIVHYKHEKALIDFYKQQGQSICEMQVERPLEDVFREFTTLLGIKVA